MTAKHHGGHDEAPKVQMSIPKTVGFRVTLQLIIAVFTVTGSFAAGYIIFKMDDHNDARYVRLEAYIRQRADDEKIYQDHRQTTEKFSTQLMTEQNRRLDSIEKKMDVLLMESRQETRRGEK